MLGRDAKVDEAALQATLACNHTASLQYCKEHMMIENMVSTNY